MDIKEYLTKNRKLKLEEYDDNGTLIDVIEFTDNDLYEFCVSKVSSYKEFDIVRKAEREYFKGEELEIFHKLRFALNKYGIYITKKEIDEMDVIIKNNDLEVLKFVLDFKDFGYSNYLRYQFPMQEKSKYTCMNFFDVLEWVKNTHGIWYAVDNKGNRGMTYSEKPTKKQAQYQRTKNGMRIVYLSFKDFKEYLVEENELK